jgi:hypothetical protein
MGSPTSGDAKTHKKKGSTMAQLTDRFAAALRTLVSDGTVKQRLSRAYAECLEDLQGNELPPALRQEFGALQAALCRRDPAGSETRVRASVQKMSPLEACDHAGTIVRLYVELLGQGERAEPLKVVSRQKPPRYLSGP